MMITRKEAAATLLRRRAARRELGAYIEYTNPKYKTSEFSRVVCAALDKFIVDVFAGKRPILIFQAPPQHGKLIADDVPVLTADGWKLHGELKVGDRVLAPDGEFANIVAVSDKAPADVRVELTDGSVFYCHERHEWTLYSRDRKREVTLETSELLRARLHTGETGKRGSRYMYQLPKVRPVIGERKSLPVAPYALGAWLGDGTRVAGRISGDWRDVEIVNAIISDGYPLSSIWAHKETGVLTSSFVGLWSDLKRAGVTSKQGQSEPKHIPDVYFTATVADRLELLAGLIDTDGYVYAKNGRTVFTTAERELADSVAKLVSTFGWRATIVEELPRVSSSGIVGTRPYWVVGFNPDIEIPCRLTRKRVHKAPEVSRRVAIKSVTYDPRGKIGHCVQVDRTDGLYLIGDNLTPTHNSEIVSRKLPAYIHGRFPDLRVAGASYSDELAGAMAQDVRRNLVNEQHQKLFPAPTTKKKYAIDRTGEFNAPGGEGSYLGVGVGAGLTGRPVDIGIIDDPVKNEKEALSPTIKEGHWNWYQSVFTTRLSENSGQIIMATSWAEDDLPGRICAAFEGDPRLTVLRFPALNEPDEAGYNPRLPEGPLVPDLHSRGKLLETKGLLSDYWWSALYQQTPKALGGNVFKESGVRYYLPKDLPKKFDKVVASLDATFKDTDGTDYVVCQVWGKLGANSYLLDQTRGRLSFTATVEMVIETKQTHPRIRQFYIEDKANGPAIIDALKGVISGLIPIEPDGSKLARAHAVTHVWEAGNVWLPHPDVAPWVKLLVGELTAFPAAANDDQVDAMTQALRQLYPLFERFKISRETVNRALGRRG